MYKEDEPIVVHGTFTERFCMCGNPLLANSEKIRDMCYECVDNSSRDEGDPIELNFEE